MFYRRHTVSAASRDVRLTDVDAIPAPDADSLDFFVTGDSGSESEVRVAVVEAMAKAHANAPADFLVLTGDNVYPAGVTSATDPAWKLHVEDAFAPLIAAMPIVPCLGNHDHMGNAAAQIEYAKTHDFWRLPAAYHSFEEAVGKNASAEFFVLDTTPIRELALAQLRFPKQAAWLEEAAARSTASWKIAIGHHPFASGGPKGGSSKTEWAFSPIFADHDFDIYLSGHNHDLELIDSGRGWIQVVSGAGAAPQPVSAVRGTRLMASGGGFVRVSLRADAAWLEYFSTEESLGAYRLERVTA